MTEQPKKSNTWLIIGIAVVAVAIGCCIIAVVIGAFMPKTTNLAANIPLETPPARLPTEAPIQPVEAQATMPPEPTVAPQLGTDRSNPIPIGQSAQSGNLTLTVGNVTRPADSIVAQGNMFNPTPEPGTEYVMFDLTVTCTAASDQKCTIGLYLETSMVGDKGVVYEPKSFIAGIPNMFETTEMFGGATVTGAMVFEVGQGEGNLVLMYEPFLKLAPKVYLAVQ